MAGPGLQLLTARVLLAPVFLASLFALQAHIMYASFDNLSIPRHPTRMEHHSVDLVIWVSFEVALVVWTDVF